MIELNVEQHHVTAACHEFHCTIHQVDEPLEGYQLCAECGHMFLTPEELVDADFMAQAFAIGLPPLEQVKLSPAAAEAMAALGVTTGPSAKVEPFRQDPEAISFCPHCAHDF